MNLQLKFARERQDFFATLSARVNDYFRENQIKKTANREMVVKTIVMFSLYFVPFVVMLTAGFTSGWLYVLCYVVMGLGTAGIGLSIMHDANHGAYSSKPWVNTLLGASLNLVGGHAFNWKIQHNVLHHTYTNVHDTDEDISPRGVLRLSPSSKWRPIHRFQHLYAWFFYGLMTLVWVSFKDFSRLINYEREGLVRKQRSSYAREWVLLILSKVVYFGYVIGLPAWLTPLTWGESFLGFLLMHYIAGFILAIIFQPAHVIDGTEYPTADADNNLANNWAIHQLRTTTNFGHRERLLSWYVGGLNYQVEHHLFPTICHVHYRALAPIVQQTAAEFGLPYKSKDTLWEALKAHTVQLQQLGQPPVMQLAR